MRCVVIVRDPNANLFCVEEVSNKVIFSKSSLYSYLYMGYVQHAELALVDSLYSTVRACHSLLYLYEYSSRRKNQSVVSVPPKTTHPNSFTTATERTQSVCESRERLATVGITMIVANSVPFL
jgi:hypothetical protein